MANKIFDGEPLALVGALKENNVGTTAYTVLCQILTPDRILIREITMAVDQQTNKYICRIDTSGLPRTVYFRFIARTQSGDKVVGNEDIRKEIYR